MKELILRFLEGQASEEEASRLLAWLQENETHRLYFDELNTAFQSSVTLNRVNHQMTEDAWRKLAVATGADNNNVIIMRNRRTFVFTALNIAASICLFIVAGALLVYNLPKGTTVRHDTLVRTASGNNTRIVLPDSSIVWLNQNSTLEYPAEFGTASRDVVLKGEAFFDVRKGRKPFTVKTDNIFIKVKGTRFNVEAFKNEPTVKTTLEEGKVELQVSGAKQVYSMAPGDQVVFNADQQKVTMHRVDPSNFTAWKEDRLVFDNAPLSEVLTKLENRFRVNIRIDERLAKRERLSMTIEDEGLDEVLDLIQLSSRLRAKKDNNTIILFE
ncbi:FecR family protein [Ohtaekwangia sp.]